MILTAPSKEVQELLRILGIDPKFLLGVDIRIRSGELVSVTLIKHVEANGEWSEVPQMFHLMPAEKANDV